MIYAISYADEKYENPMKWNLETALEQGVDEVIGYSPIDIDENFYEKNKKILDCKRGAGYWIWKPYIILKTLKMIEDNDYVIYSDAGSIYVNKVKILIDKMESDKESIMVFEQPPYIEKEWSKRDAFILMNCDHEKFYNTYQLFGGYIVIKKTEFAIKFVEEWLRYCEDERIVTDNQNVLGLDNYPGFKENRHDQTVLSLLAKRKGIRIYEDPSCSIVVWLGEPINYGENIWLSHKTPYVCNLNDLLNTNQEFYEQYWDNEKEIIIYGAGYRGKQFYECAKKLNKRIKAFVVSKENYIKERYIDNIPVYSMENLPIDISECKFVVTMCKGKDEVNTMLKKYNAIFINYEEYNRNNVKKYWVMSNKKLTNTVAQIHDRTIRRKNDL